MEVIDLERPSPRSDEVLVEVEYAGLCGSDAGVYEYENAYDRMDVPTVIGHEYAGRVVETGENVTGLEPGQRVVERPIRGCGDCYQCRRGEPNICRDAAITGVDHHGAYTRYIAVPEAALNAVPDDVDPRHAAVVEPTSIGTRAVTQNSRVRAGSTALVLGPGPIGLLTAQVADVQGGDVVVAGVSRDRDYRLPLAEELGFETMNVETDDREALRDEYTGGRGYDVVFDTTGHPSGLPTAAEEVCKGGQVMVVGLPGEATMSYSPLVRAEIGIQCSYASDWLDFDRTISLIRSGDVAVEPMLDERFSLRDADDAFETFLAGETCKPLFDVSVLDE